MRKWLKRKVILTGEQHQAMDCRGVLRGNADPFRASDAPLGKSRRRRPPGSATGNALRLEIHISKWLVSRYLRRLQSPAERLSHSHDRQAFNASEIAVPADQCRTQRRRCRRHP